MGAWGNHPTESDSGQEFLDEALAKLPREIQKGLRSDDHQEVRAAAFLLEQVGYAGVYPGDLEEDLNLAIAQLKKLLQDKELVESWKSPKAWKASVQQQIKSLQQRQRKPVVPGTKGLLQQLGVDPDGKFLKKKLLS